MSNLKKECVKFALHHLTEGTETLVQIIRPEKARLMVVTVDGIRGFISLKNLIDSDVELPLIKHFKARQWMRASLVEKVKLEEIKYPRLEFKELEFDQSSHKPQNARERLKALGKSVMIDHAGQYVEVLIALITYKCRDNKLKHVNGTSLQPKQSELVGMKVVYGKQIGYIPASQCGELEKNEVKVGDYVRTRVAVLFERPTKIGSNTNGVIFLGTLAPPVVTLAPEGYLGPVEDSKNSKKRERNEEFGSLTAKKKVKLDEKGKVQDGQKHAAMNEDAPQKDLEEEQLLESEDTVSSSSSSSDDSEGCGPEDVPEVVYKSKKRVEEDSNEQDVEDEDSLIDEDLEDADHSTKAVSDESSDSEESSGEVDEVKLTQREKLFKNLEEQEVTRQKELTVADLSVDNASSIDDYERLIITQGKTAEIWIRYMAYHCDQTQIEKARTVSERALGSIPLASENERLDLWIAKFNLEVNYGDERHQKLVLDEALRRNDEREVYKRCAEVLYLSSEFKATLLMMAKATAKFPQNTTLWKFYLEKAYAIVPRTRKNVKKGKVNPKKLALDEAKDIGNKCRKSFDGFPKDEVVMRIEIAKNEFLIGELEQGAATFDELVGDKPKRIDLWSMYLDQMIKYNTAPFVSTTTAINNGIKRIRRLFVRATTVPDAKPQKLNKVFAKWLSFEKDSGNSEGVKLVKMKHKKFIEEAKKALYLKKD